MATGRGTDLDEVRTKISEEEIKECQQHFAKGGAKACAEFLHRKMKEWMTVALDIGITGNVKTGKSSFINAIRGLTADDEGAAEVDVVEATMEPKAYAHPNNELLKFWDLPGLGTCKFPKEKYLEKVGFSKYDFFLIMSSDTFTENDKWLAGEIASKKKKYFFVRTKVDQHIQNDQRSHPRTHNPDKVLVKIVENVKQNLGDQFHSNRVFLIDNYMPLKYDFDKLTERLVEDFPSLKREALILSMTAFSKEMVQRKVKALRGGIWRSVVVTMTASAVPIPNWFSTVGLEVILERSLVYFHQLGLDDESLRKMARVMDCNETRLQEIVPCQWQYWLAGRDGIQELIKPFQMQVQMTPVQDFLRCLPIVGTVAGMSHACDITIDILNRILTEMEKLALTVMEAAILEG